MKRAIAEKLQELANQGEHIEQEWEYSTWSLRVKAFLDTTLGPDQALAFSSLVASAWPETLALQRGHLEGLALIGFEESSSTAEPDKRQQHPDRRKVFVLHGHDDAAKESVARFIEKIELSPIILHEQPNAGRTLIEKFETYSGDVAFAVVLLTPDDVGSEVRAAAPGNPRARQNVIMELGYFIGKLGRTRVCALHKGGVELPSDYQGVVYVEMDAGGAWKTKLAQELVQSKISIDLKGLLA